MDVGAALRDAREQRGISIEELSRLTKIRVATLRALERNQIDRLPGGIFVRGFLKAYAHEVGLDAEETVQRYLAQFEPPLDPPPAAGEMDVPSGSMQPAPAVADTNTSAARAISLRVLLVGLVIAIGATTYLAVREPRTAVSSDQSPAPASTSGLHRASTISSAEEIATSGQQESTAPADQREDIVRLEVQASGICWIAASADGRTVVYRLMQAGERDVIEAHDHIVLRVGDPAAFAYRINDLQGRQLGRAGEPVTIRISRQNYREFVEP